MLREPVEVSFFCNSSKFSFHWHKFHWSEFWQKSLKLTETVCTENQY